MTAKPESTKEKDKREEPAPFSGNTDPTGGEASYIFSSWFFLRALGLVYLCAFLSAWSQIIGLIGEKGILPVSSYLNILESSDRWMPTLLWLGNSDLALHILCGAGVVLALLLLSGVFPVLVLFLLWLFYLSLSIGGQVFFHHQWDSLLLEVGFLALFLTSWKLLPRWKNAQQPPLLTIWMFRWLLFRFMFFSGYVKLASGDPSWFKLSAMNNYYWTQPLPSWIGWYVHSFPVWMHETSVVLILAIELVVPFAMLATRMPRMIAGLAIFGLQVVIVLTGNFGFFNFLVMVLCILLFDDAFLRHLLPGRLSQKFPIPSENETILPYKRIPKLAILGFFLSSLFVFSLFQESKRFEVFAFAKEPTSSTGLNWYQKANRILKNPAKRVLRSFSLRNRSKTFRSRYNALLHFRFVNRYGLFAKAAKKRMEIILEGSEDGSTWKPYVFKWKPVDTKRRPRVIGPHMPRLDWEMCSATLYPRSKLWVKSLARRVLEGEKSVLNLLDINPFAKQPPRYVRAVWYEYQFTTPKARDMSGAWWGRVKKGLYFPPMKL